LEAAGWLRGSEPSSAAADRNQWATASLAGQGWRRTAQWQSPSRLASATPCRAQLLAPRCAGRRASPGWWWSAPGGTTRPAWGFRTQTASRAEVRLGAETSPRSW
jgi:hypothetical protein